MVPVARVDVNPGASLAWTDVDITPHVGADAGNIAGVVLEIVMTGGWSCKDVMLRKNGSGDTYVKRVTHDTHQWCFIGCDPSDIFEIYLQNHNDIQIFLVAYVTTAEGSFFTNHIDKTPALGAWNDVDISGDTGGDTAVLAFFYIENQDAGALGGSGIRNNGSGDDRKQQFGTYSLSGAFMSVDANEKCEIYLQFAGTWKVWLLGYLTANYTSFVNAPNYSTAVLNAWDDVDFSPDIPVGWDGACCDFHPTVNTAFKGGLRLKTDVFDNWWWLRFHTYPWVQINAARICEQKISENRLDLFLFGYTRQPPAANPPTAPTAQQIDGQSSPIGENCISSLTPGFTAIYNDPDAGDTSNAINIQVGTASGLSDLWDSGWLADATITPNRCAAKTYAGAALSMGTSYWWRCRFRDNGGLEGAWSAWQQFDMCEEVPEEIPIQCVPGGPLPRRRPFACAVRVPLLEPSRRFPFEFPIPRSPCN